MDIADHLRQITILVHHDGLVSPPKKRSVATVKPIEPLCVKPIEVLHYAGKIPLRGTQANMIVIAHQAISEYFHSPTIMKFSERSEKSFVVLFLQKSLLPGASTVHHVVDSSCVLNTERPSHDESGSITPNHELSTTDLTPVTL
jgi:hypothetical protein